MISVIIPTYNEEANIKSTIQALWKNDVEHLVKQVIVVDGGSSDDTLKMATIEGVLAVVSPRKGRAAQMNYGASLAKQTVLYFLHADSAPPPAFSTQIVSAILAGNGSGCFRLQFDHAHWFLKVNCWFTRFNVAAFHYGDQSLFVKQSVFEDIRGFPESHIVFEDYAIIKELKRKGPFYIVKKPVITSARKYLQNGIFKMQGIFYLMYFLYRMGLPQPKLVSVYKRMILQDKI